MLLCRLWWLSGFTVSSKVYSLIVNIPPTTIMTSLTLSNFCYLILSSVSKSMQLAHACPTVSCIHLVYCVHMILCDPLSENPTHPATTAFELEVMLSSVHIIIIIGVIFQAGGECTVSRTLTHDLTQYPPTTSAGSPTKVKAH